MITACRAGNQVSLATRRTRQNGSRVWGRTKITRARTWRTAIILPGNTHLRINFTRKDGEIQLKLIIKKNSAMIFAVGQGGNKVAKMTDQDKSDLLSEVRIIIRSSEEIPTMESLGIEYGEITRERVRQFLNENLTAREMARLKVKQKSKKAKVDELNKLRAKRLSEELRNQPEKKFKTLAELCDFLEIDKKTYDAIAKVDEVFHCSCIKRLDRSNSGSLKQKVLSFLKSAIIEKRKFTVDDIVVATGAKDSASIEATCCRLVEFQKAKKLGIFIDRRKGKLGDGNSRRKKRNPELPTEEILLQARKMIAAGEWAESKKIASDNNCKNSQVWCVLYNHLTEEERAKNRENRKAKKH